MDRVRGWTPDGKRVVFASARLSPPHNSYFRLFTIALDGGLPEPLPMPRAYTGTYSADGKRVAYEEVSTVMFPGWIEASGWRHYRGGRTHPIRVMNLADNSVTKLPWTDSNDAYPVWIGNTVYFLSDRTFTTNLFSYNADTKELKQLTHHDDFDIANASAGPDAVVYEQAGYIHLVDAKTGQSRRLNIDVTGDLPWARAGFKRVSGMIRGASLSPAGVRVAIEARGDIFTVPVEKGDYRNLTKSTAVNDRDPVWSPDGTQLAWVSDASGEYQLMIGEQTGITKPRAINLPEAAFFSELAWSPDGKQLSFQDNHLNLWALDVASGKATKIDSDTFDDPSRAIDPVWSPDSRWLAYSKNLDNHYRAIFAYSFADGKAYQITDGMSDAVSPAFDAGGKYLYFLASTNYGPAGGWLEMSSTERPVRRSIYFAVLSATEPCAGAGSGSRRRATEARFHHAHRHQGDRSARVVARGAAGRVQQPHRRSGRHDLLHGADAECRRRAAIASRAALRAQGPCRCAVHRGRSLVFALGRSEEAALPGGWRCRRRTLGRSAE